MKRIWLILVVLFCFSFVRGQFTSFGVHVGAGYTMVDVAEAVQTYNLSDWDNFGMIIKAFGEYELKPEIFVVGELGSNRLYYWEYPYSTGTATYYRWRSEWTYNLGISLKKMITDEVYVQAGPAVHIFEDGSGTVLGLLGAIGYNLSVSDQIEVPIGIRIEPVFGNAVPISFLVNAGLKYNLH